MNQNEIQWDRFLKIRTSGRDDSHADQYRYPYEPTAYVVLERLANSGLIRKNNTLLDYGPAREESVFTCPIRQGVKQSESNTMNVFIRGQQKIRRRQCPETVLPLS